MNLAELYSSLNQRIMGGETLPFAEKTFVGFYKAFVDGGRWQLYIDGVLNTLRITAMALILGVILGILVAVVRTAHDQQRPGRKNPVLGLLNTVCQVYTTIIRGTLVGALTLGINSGAYVAEIFRGGLMSVDSGQNEAGRSLGLNYLDTMRFIVVPQAFKNVLPALGNEFITLFKDTALINIIGGKELVYAAQAVGSKTYDVMYPYLGIAVIYLVMVMLLTWLQGKLERRLRQSDRR